MTLASNALCTVAALERYMRNPIAETDLLSVYHDQSASATAAVVGVITNLGETASILTLTITGGDNAGAQAFSSATYGTITQLVAGIIAYGKGWSAHAIRGDATMLRLASRPSTSAFGLAATQYLRGIDSSAYEQAINAASDEIERYCGRTFASSSYRELYSAKGRDTLRLRHFPITAISRIAIGRASLLNVTNTQSDARDATIKNDLTNLSCTIIGGANAGTDTVAIGTNTITQLAAAITALGKGWTALASSTAAGAYPGTELFKHEPWGCHNKQITLFGPEKAETDLQVDLEAGIIRRGSSGGLWMVPFYDMHHATHVPPFVEHGGRIWPSAQHNVFVAYTAGYSTIPDDLAQLCCELAASMIRAGQHDSNLQSESILGYSATQRDGGWMTDGFKARLNKWRQFPPIPECVVV